MRADARYDAVTPGFRFADGISGDELPPVPPDWLHIPFYAGDVPAVLHYTAVPLHMPACDACCYGILASHYIG